MSSRKRLGLLFLLVPIVAVILGLAIGSATGNNDQSHTSHMLGDFASANILLGLLYFIPFMILGVKYLFGKAKKAEVLPAPDAVDHSINVKFTSSVLKQYLNFWGSQHGTLVWNHTNKTIRLVQKNNDQSVSVFDIPYTDVQELNEIFNLIKIRVHGVTYACTPDNLLVNVQTTVGTFAGQGGTLVTGAMQFISAGIPELGKRLAVEGVQVVTVRVNYAFQVGVVFSFVILYLGAIVVSLFLVK